MHNRNVCKWSIWEDIVYVIWNIYVACITYTYEYIECICLWVGTCDIYVWDNDIGYVYVEWPYASIYICKCIMYTYDYIECICLWVDTCDICLYVYIVWYMYVNIYDEYVLCIWEKHVEVIYVCNYMYMLCMEYV